MGYLLSTWIQSSAFASIAVTRAPTWLPNSLCCGSVYRIETEGGGGGIEAVLLAPCHPRGVTTGQGETEQREGEERKREKVYMRGRNSKKSLFSQPHPSFFLKIRTMI